MKILFIGTVLFSKKALEKLINLKADIVGVCTKEKSKFNSDFANLTEICKKNKIPYKYAENINSNENIEWIKNLNPDIIFCFGWSQILRSEILNIPKMGVIGYHPAQLPKNRGRHPLIWALVLGLDQTASTFFFMDEGADSGDILSQEKIEIDYEDDADTLYKKIIDKALMQIENFLPKLQNNTFEKIPQNHEASNTWRKRGQKDGIIDFRMSSRAIYNLVRALTKPYIGAEVLYQENYVKIWKVEEVFEVDKNIEMGKVISIDKDTITIKTYDNAIKITKHEFILLPKIGEYL